MLEAALELVRSPQRANSTALPSRARILAVSEVAKSAAAKVGFMFAKGRPDSEIEKSLLKALSDSLFSMCMLLASVAAGEGPSLRQAVDSAANGLVGSGVALIKASVQMPPPSILPRLAGLCMEECDAAARVPLDNKTAVGRSLTRVARQIADAAKELKQFVEEFEEQDEDENEEDIVRTVALAAQKCISSTHDVVKAVIKALLAVDSWADGGGDDSWEGVLRRCRDLSAAADELAAAVYSAEESSEDVSNAGEELMGLCEGLVEAIPVEGGAVNDAVIAVRKAINEMTISCNNR